MKIIKPSVEFFGAVPTDYENTLKFIEMAGRTCYKSEDKITPDSAEGFVKRLIKAGHLAMVEHSNFVVRTYVSDDYEEYILNSVVGSVGKYLNVVVDGDYLYVGGSLTAWAQRCSLAYKEKFDPAFMTINVPFMSGAYSDLFDADYLPYVDLGDFYDDWQVCPHDEVPKELHRYSAKFICDRGVSHELVRHRPCSFAQESTRYVNYAGKDMEFIEPAGFEGWGAPAKHLFECFNAFAQTTYETLISEEELKPQQARAVLPNALKTEIVVTADAAEWMHIKKLRTAAAAHPDIQRVMNMMPWGEME